MEKHFVIPEEEFKALQQVSRHGKGLPPQKSEYERLVELNTSLQDQLKQPKPQQRPFPERLQRIWDMMISSLPGLSYNKMWEVVFAGETWGDSNVFDLLKAASDEKFPPPRHFPRLMELIRQARIPESLLGRFNNAARERNPPVLAVDDDGDQPALERTPAIWDTAIEDVGDRPARERKRTVWSSRPIREKKQPPRYEALPIAFKKLKHYAVQKRQVYK